MRAPSVWIFAPGVTTSVAKSIMSSPPGLSATSRRTRPRRPRAVRSTAMVIGVLSLNPPGFPALLPPRKLWSSSTMTLGSAPSSSRSGRTIALRRLVQPGPRGLIGPESQGVLEALGRDSVLLRRHEPYRGEPRRERGVGTVEDRPGRDRGLQGALDAHSKPSPNVPTLATATARARETSRPAEPGEILPTSLVIRKPGPKLLVRPRVVHPAYWAGARRHFPSLLHSSRDAGRLFGSSWMEPRLLAAVAVASPVVHVIGLMAMPPAWMTGFVPLTTGASVFQETMTRVSPGPVANFRWGF